MTCLSREAARVNFGDDYSDGVEFRLTLPLSFFQDHEDRELPHGWVVRQTKRQVVVMMTEAEIREMYSDADYYATMIGEDRSENIWYVNAAKRMLVALDREVSAIQLGREEA
jgi:hypothetical protein